MPFVKRNADGQICALLAQAEQSGQEFLESQHPDVLAFLGHPESLFEELDHGLIRVIEDLVDVLIRKNILRLTDLPAPAQEKLLSRKRAREQMKQHLDILDSDKGLL